jgi:hypothetical protein
MTFPEQRKGDLVIDPEVSLCDCVLGFNLYTSLTMHSEQDLMRGMRPETSFSHL